MKLQGTVQELWWLHKAMLQDLSELQLPAQEWNQVQLQAGHGPSGLQPVESGLVEPKLDF